MDFLLTKVVFHSKLIIEKVNDRLLFRVVEIQRIDEATATPVRRKVPA